MDFDVKEELMKFSIIIIVGVLFTVATLYFGLQYNVKNLSGRAYMVPAPVEMSVMLMQSVSVYCLIAAICLLVLKRYNQLGHVSELRHYILSERAAGFPDKDIKAQLAQVGWPESILKDEFGNQKP